MFLNLLFIGIFSVNFLLKIFSLSCRWKSKSSEEGSQQIPTIKYIDGGISLGISYQISKWCCSIALASHSANFLLLILHKQRSHCNYMLSVLAEITQVASWIVMLIAVFSFQKSILLKLPWTIRLWWISSFFQASVCMSFNIHAAFQHTQLIGVEEYLGLLSLLACAYLSIISVSGATGISIANSSSLEPLLQSSTDKQLERKQESPYGKASLPQLVTFSWLNPLFVLGKQKPLEQAEVPDVDIKDSAEFLSHSFDEYLTSVKEKYGLRNSSIF